jgi:hypothetical protein
MVSPSLELIDWVCLNHPMPACIKSSGRRSHQVFIPDPLTMVSYSVSYFRDGDQFRFPSPDDADSARS